MSDEFDQATTPEENTIKTIADELKKAFVPRIKLFGVCLSSIIYSDNGPSSEEISKHLPANLVEGVREYTKQAIETDPDFQDIDTEDAIDANWPMLIYDALLTTDIILDEELIKNKREFIDPVGNINDDFLLYLAAIDEMMLPPILEALDTNSEETPTDLILNIAHQAFESGRNEEEDFFVWFNEMREIIQNKQNPNEPYILTN
jgi:hypothetical protein